MFGLRISEAQVLQLEEFRRKFELVTLFDADTMVGVQLLRTLTFRFTQAMLPAGVKDPGSLPAQALATMIDKWHGEGKCQTG